MKVRFTLAFLESVSASYIGTAKVWTGVRLPPVRATQLQPWAWGPDALTLAVAYKPNQCFHYNIIQVMQNNTHLTF